LGRADSAAAQPGTEGAPHRLMRSVDTGLQGRSMSRTRTIHFVLNGEEYERSVPVHRTLADFLRRDLGMTGTKIGCDAGDCGACTILMDGRPVVSCLVLAVEADGTRLRTVEGLADRTAPGRLHPLQRAFVERGAVQCGYCTPGMLMTAVALLEEHPAADDRQIREALAGNLCRCTGYTRIVDAVRSAAESAGANEVPR
jgi:carbon-monoxide dehydrogenase small subunit